MFRFLPALFVLALPGIAHATPCTAGAEAQHVLAFQDRLANAPASPEQEDVSPLDTGEITPAARQAVLGLQEALSTAITRALQCEAATLTAPAAIEASLARLLQANRPSLSAARAYQQGDSMGNGKALAIAVQRLAGMDDTIAITASFTLGCGGDNILLLFRRQQNSWQHILNWYNSNYAHLYDGFGDFFRYTVTPGANGAKLIAVVHGNSGCSAPWGDFALDLLAPATAEAPQKLLGHGRGEYLPNGGEDGKPDISPFILRADGFTFKTSARSADDDLFSYTGVFRYKTLANSLDRQPAANNVRDFVDSWLDESWPTAARWSEQPLEPLHNAWAFFHSDKGASIQFGPVRACTQTGQFQVQINQVTQVSPTRPLRYAKVLQGNGVFTLLALTPSPDPGCTGPDLMPKRQK